MSDTLYIKTLDYLYQKLPYFSRDGKAALKPNLDNIIAFCEYLDNPQDKYKTIHVAGTNGKGSVSHSLAALLQKHGFKTGLTTSPHLIDFRERMRVDGLIPPSSFVVEFVANHKSFIEKLKPSFFEISLAMAFYWFALQKVDIAVIETGLGGRLDSTNIVKPLLTVITNISYDHQDLLGNTLVEIAGEKAGIIKPFVPTLIGRFQPSIHHVFEEKALKEDAPLYLAKNLALTLPPINFELKGICQQENLKTVLAAFELLKPILNINSSLTAVSNALQNVTSLTGLRGRWEVIQSENPFIVTDTAHNQDGLEQVFSQLESISKGKLHVVFGMVNDKNRDSIWPLLNPNAQYYFCKPNIARGLDEKLLANEANTYGFVGAYFDSVDNAYNNAISNANNEDTVFVGGSTFVVAELLANLERI